MHALVNLFFIVMTIATFLAGLTFRKTPKSAVLRLFGDGLMLISLSYFIWSVAVILGHQKYELSVFVIMGLVVFFVAQLLFVRVATHDSDDSQQIFAIIFFLILASIIILVKMIFPSMPIISSEGMLFFNPHDLVAFLEIVLISIGAVSAGNKVVQELQDKKGNLANWFLAAWMGLFVGTLVLLVSTKILLLVLTGWIMLIASVILIFVAFKITDKKTKA